MNGLKRNLDPSPGTYALVFACSAPFQAVVGKLGRVHVSAGHWIYLGSAFGPGGLRSRLLHHLKPSQRPHWHLDYIKASLQVVAVWTTTDAVKREHDWANILAALKCASRPIMGFGAADCSCLAHLIHMSRRPSFSGFVDRIHRTIPGHTPLSSIDLVEISNHLR